MGKGTMTSTYFFMAAKLQKTVLSHLVRQANFYVIKRISMPAVLVEMCFISNEKELTLMKGQWFQKKTARLIAEGIEK